MIPIRARLRAALIAAMKQRDREATALYRTVLAAIDHAEAVPIPPDFVPHLTRPNEAPRRPLSEAEIRAIVQDEAASLRQSAAQLDEARRSDRAAPLWQGAAQLDALLAAAPPPEGEQP